MKFVFIVNLENIQLMKNLMIIYIVLFNKAKTTVFFSKSTKEDRRDSIKNTLGVTEIRHYEKYLGLPSLVGKNKKSSFNYIKERVWRKLQGWEEKLLSQAG